MSSCLMAVRDDAVSWEILTFEEFGTTPVGITYRLWWPSSRRPKFAVKAVISLNRFEGANHLERKDVNAWVKQNLKGKMALRLFSGAKQLLLFNSVDDAMLFKLRWQN